MDFHQLFGGRSTFCFVSHRTLPCREFYVLRTCVHRGHTGVQSNIRLTGGQRDGQTRVHSVYRAMRMRACASRGKKLQQNNDQHQKLGHSYAIANERRLYLYPVYTIQPVVNKRLLSNRLFDNRLLSNRLYNRFDNRLYRVNKHPTGCQ